MTMGWARTLLLGDIGNRLDIDDVERNVDDLRDKVADVVQRISRISDENHRLLAADNAETNLYLAAVVRLLVDKGVVSREELRSIVAEVDLLDGQADGKFVGKIRP
jgi:hypothetical protein